MENDNEKKVEAFGQKDSGKLNANENLQNAGNFAAESNELKDEHIEEVNHDINHADERKVQAYTEKLKGQSGQSSNVDYGGVYSQGMYQNNNFMNNANQYGYTSDRQYYQPIEPSKNKKRKKKKSENSFTFGKIIAAALIFGLIAGTAFEGVRIGTGRLLNNTTSVAATTETLSSESKSDNVKKQSVSDTSSDLKTVNYDVADVAAKVMPSIVSITTKTTTDYQYYMQNYEQEETGAGSGIIIGKSDSVLYIATNYHVIEDAEEINVGFNDGEIVKASVTGYDEDNDIAVVQVAFSDMKDSTSEKISIATVGDSDSIQVGEPSIAIGNALGYGQSVTVGYISALNRNIEGSDGSFIQTDAAINPGNSGGALINAKGEVIGINSVKYVDSKVEGMGFSIPINRAMDIIHAIVSGKQTGNAFLGISGADISKDYAQIYGFPEGIYVKEVTDGSAAEKAGIHTADIIVEFDGKEVYTIEDLQKLVQAKKPGDKVKIVVYRTDSMGNYEKSTISVTLSKQSGTSKNSSTATDGDADGE